MPIATCFKALLDPRSKRRDILYWKPVAHRLQRHGFKFPPENSVILLAEVLDEIVLVTPSAVVAAEIFDKIEATAFSAPNRMESRTRLLSNLVELLVSKPLPSLLRDVPANNNTKYD